MTNWLIYALGGGWGHITRALSLGRIAVAKTQVKILTNSPYAKKIDSEGCIVQQIPHELDYAATCQQVREILVNTECEVLIIDTFPRGLGGELADILPQLEIPKILIHRDINPGYVIAKELRSFVYANFDAIIVPGEREVPFSDLPNVQYTAPWLIRNAWELPDINTTRKHILQVEESVKIILVCASGQASELPLFGKLTLQLQETFPNCAVKILAATSPVECPLDMWVRHHPGIECLAAADIVVGSGGYNTVYECAAVGVPLVALTRKRLYDRQDKRAAISYPVSNIEGAISTVRMLLLQVKFQQKPDVLSYVNGAVQAADYILRVRN
jgi:hypothetical protein